MSSLDNWEFKLVLRLGAASATLNELSNGLMDDAVEWAEARHYGIGGGYRIVAGPAGPESAFGFGLCITRDEQFVSLISEAEADDLLRHMQRCAAAKGAELSGIWKPFDENYLTDDFDLSDDSK